MLITGGRASLCLPYPMGLGVHAGEKATVQMILTRKHSLVFLGDVRSFMRWGDSEKRKQTDTSQGSSKSCPRRGLPGLSPVSHGGPAWSFHPPSEASGGGKGQGRRPWQHAPSVCCGPQGHSGSCAGRRFPGKTPVPKQKRLFTVCPGCGTSRLTHCV